MSAFFLLPPQKSGSLNYIQFLSFKINSVYYCLFNAAWSTVEQYSEIVRNHSFELLNAMFSQKIRRCRRPCIQSSNTKIGFLVAGVFTQLLSLRKWSQKQSYTLHNIKYNVSRFCKKQCIQAGLNGHIEHVLLFQLMWQMVLQTVCMPPTQVNTPTHPAENSSSECAVTTAHQTNLLLTSSCQSNWGFFLLKRSHKTHLTIFHEHIQARQKTGAGI